MTDIIIIFNLKIRSPDPNCFPWHQTGLSPSEMRNLHFVHIWDDIGRRG